jgi:hypothetical protein
MSGIPSFARIDYQIRSNKNIERKIVFDVLSHVQAVVDFSHHKYLGLGSMWFTDFRLAHKLLGLDRMISIERTDSARAEFNKPYRNIEVKDGDCLNVLRGLDDAEWQDPFITWFDFDGNLDEEICETMNLYLNKCAPNSVLLITVNATASHYQRGRKRVQDERSGTSVGVIEEFLGKGCVDIRFEPKITGGQKYEDISQSDFCDFLADALLNHMEHKITSTGRESGMTPVQFVPVFSFFHKDGADMVTVGGIIASKGCLEEWRKGLGEYFPSSDGKKPDLQCIDLVPMTLKEKLELDACLPYSEEEFLGKAESRGLKIDSENMKKYRHFYRHFPVFGETQI